MMSNEPLAPVGDSKDWTWATEKRCPDCGFDPGGVVDGGIGDALRSTVARFSAVLARGGIGVRPEPRTWSPLEYACHVRDVHGVFVERLALMLAQGEPRFPDWDQDAAAVAGRYWECDPAQVADDIADAAEAVARAYDDVPVDAWSRAGLRGDGGQFTVSTLGRYHLHDVVHHLWDVAG